jgi:serine phosphatase RsbU (regulator of sigma subunit)
VEKRLESGTLTFLSSGFDLPKVLSAFADSKFSQAETVDLQGGELLILTTDGITEATARDGNQFGASRVLDYVRAHASEPASRISSGVHQAARDYVEYDPQDDDITALVIKVEDVVNGKAPALAAKRSIK